MINKESINNDIENLLIEYGGDGHIDGSKQITEYIVNLVNNKLQDAADNIEINIKQHRATSPKNSLLEDNKESILKLKIE
jgi:hypothetical protein